MSGAEAVLRLDPPTAELARKVQERYPENPFYNPAYAQALQRVGRAPFLLVQTTAHGEWSACLALIQTTWRGQVIMELPSLTAPADPVRYWQQVESLCHDQGVGRLQLRTFGSQHSTVPSHSAETIRRPRTEWRIPLSAPDLTTGFSSHHRRQIRRGERSGLELRTGCTDTQAHHHQALVSAGQSRRRRLGKAAAPERHDPLVPALLRTGAAQLYQAVLDGRISASVLVLVTRSGAYYHSAGVDEAGTRCGASHWLVAQVARRLSMDGCRMFNLGGTRASEQGLVRFKSGFGARPVELLSVDWALPVTFMRRSLIAAAAIRRRLLRH